MPDSTNTQGKRRPLVMGNWKMNGRQANNEALLSALKPAVAGFDTIDVAVCPPFPYLSQTASQLADSNITFGAQNLSAQQDGAYTGEVSSGMLVDLKVRWRDRRDRCGQDAGCAGRRPHPRHLHRRDARRAQDR